MQINNKYTQDELDNMLIEASNHGHLEPAKLLLSMGADVHAYNDYALRWTARYGHLQVVELLLKHGADVHVRNDYALRWAADNGHLQVVEFLQNYVASGYKI